MRRFFGLGPRLAPVEVPSLWELKQNKPELKGYGTSLGWAQAWLLMRWVQARPLMKFQLSEGLNTTKLKTLTVTLKTGTKKQTYNHHFLTVLELELTAFTFLKTLRTDTQWNYNTY